MPAPAKSKYYGSEFYRDQSSGSSRSASVVVPLVLSKVKISSVIDVGCGVGTWAAQFTRFGVSEVRGLDGDYVDRSQLLIPDASFQPYDLQHRILMDQVFDLAVCMEVAEHLPGSRAASLVQDLTRLAPCVLFSAAIPGQQGTNHINEQKLSYWIARFEQFGYTAVDLIRPLVWDNPDVEWWYRQNAVLFAGPNHPILQMNLPKPLDLVHPELFGAVLARSEVRRPMPGLGELAHAMPRIFHRLAR